MTSRVSRATGAKAPPDAWPNNGPGHVGGHEDGKFTVVIYFVNEEAARRGERQEIPAELQHAMQEMMALGVGMPEFLDLRMPWLDSPK